MLNSFHRNWQIKSWWDRFTLQKIYILWNDIYAIASFDSVFIVEIMNITFINILSRNSNVKNAQNFIIRKIVIINSTNARYAMTSTLLSQIHVFVAKMNLKNWIKQRMRKKRFMSWNLKLLSKHFFSIISFFFFMFNWFIRNNNNTKRKKNKRRKREKKNNEFINTQLISLKTNDLFNKLKKVNSKNLNIIAIKKKIIAKLKILNKNLMKEFLIKIKLLINKQKTTNSSNNNSNLSFTMMFCEKEQMTHTKE